MESFWKTFSISFLLRSMFSGSFFLMSYYYTYYTYYTKSSKITINLADFKDFLGIAITISLFAGVIIYAFHRALPYALIIEPCINSKLSEKTRWGDNVEDKKKKFRLTLISENTMRYLLHVWDMDSDNNKSNRKNVWASKMYSWGDYTHFHYTAAWCIIAGNLSFFIMYNYNTHWLLCNPLLLGLAILFGLMGFISDWRLKAVREYIFIQDSLTQIKQNEIHHM